ncbi:LysR family transcriptional regulator [Variovorax sp. ZT4R33]|uniref:LysR family transcriptional regulator n=1 Tax=Variovorax sp. ZT4R33 TaxID=3443743 RepID=UPI003F4791B2
MNFLWLADFKALAATGSFSRAADERNVTQPAFSRRVRALEAWLGVDLFDRSSQPAKLTVAGEWFSDVADELLERLAALPDEAHAISEAHSATLRIASTHALSFTFLPRWLRPLETHTTVGAVQLMSDVLQRCESLIQQGKVQFVLSHAHPMSKGGLPSDAYVSVCVGKDVLIPVCSADKDGAPAFTLGQESSGPVPVLQYSTGSGIGRIVRAVLGQQLALLKTQVVVTAHLASVLRTMAIDGRGVAWLPLTLIEDDLASRRLVRASPDGRFDIPTEIRLYRSSVPAGKAGEAFWDAVLAAGSV